MEAGFFAMEAVPFAPGESPFHCKGVMYADLFAYLDETIPGGRFAVLDRIRDSRLRPFFSQPFVTGVWYDVFPLVALNRTAAMVADRPYLDFVRGFSKWTFPRQVRGIYKYLLKLTTPDMMMRGLPRAGGQFYDFVRVEVKPIRPKVYQSQTSNIPAMLAPSHMATTESAVVMLLELSGAKGVRHRWLAPADDGEAHGIKLVSVTREIAWD